MAPIERITASASGIVPGAAVSYPLGITSIMNRMFAPVGFGSVGSVCSLCSLRRLIDETYRTIRPMAERKGLTAQLQVDPAVPEFLGKARTDGKRASRLDLADWFTDSEQGTGGLTARVMVNRYWALLFGEGLARAPVHAYRWTLKPLLGHECRHLPTCSEYALEALEVPRDRIATKTRARGKGGSKYGQLAHRGELLTVREGEARLKVNLFDYLDTGLFLDHRPLRLRIARVSRARPIS